MQTPTTVGKLQAVRYETQQEKVKIVLVGGATAPAADSLRDQLNQIYGPSQTTWTVETDTYTATDWDTDRNGLNAGDNATLSQYTSEMNALKRGYFQLHSQESNTYYVFVVAGFSPSTVQGYMPRGRGVGFISSGGNVAHTLAHELGHGAFGLEHTFDEVPQGSTDNLMDYASGSRLTHWQWQQIQHPGIIISWFEDALFADAAPTITQPQTDLPDQPDWFTQTTYQLLNQYTPYYSATPAQPKTFITTDKQKFTAQVYSYDSGQTLYFEWQDVSYWYINGRWVLSTRNLASEQFYYYDKAQQKLINFKPKGSESFAEVMNRLGPGLTRFADVWQGVVLGTGGGLLAASGSIYLLIADLSIGVGTAHIDAYRGEISQLDGGQEFLEVYDDVNVALLVFAVSNATVKGAQAVARLESVQSRFAQVVSKIQSSNPALWAKVSGKWGSLSAGLSERASGVSARAKAAYDTYVAKFKEISQKVGLGSGAGRFANYLNVDKWFSSISDATTKSTIENRLNTWSDDLLAKLDNVPSKNPDFLSKAETNPSILNSFEEGSKIIFNKSASLEAVELDMYALDRARPDESSIFKLGTTDYVSNTTRKDLAKMDINAQSGKIRDANGNILTTDNVNGEGLMYVIDEADNIYIGGRGGGD